MAGSFVATKVQHRPQGVVRLNSTLVADASGVVTGGVIGSAFGKVVGIAYTPGTLDTGVDILVKDTYSGATLFTLTDAGTSPLYILPGINRSGATKTVLTSGTSNTDVFKDIYVAGKISVSAAQGGNLGAGAISVIVDEGQPAKGSA